MRFPYALMLLGCLASCGNNDKKPVRNDADSTKIASSYKLAVLKGWNVERINFPIDFAPNITYTGVEDLRFMPGWEDLTSDEHWSYAFLWWLDGKPKFDAETLEQNLTEYYDGLVKRNIVSRSIPQIKVVPAVAKINQADTAGSDSATYNGTVSMLDYISQNPMILNVIVHIKSCGANHTAAFFEISPQPYNHSVWLELNSLNTSFQCGE